MSQVVGRWNDDATFALNGFDDERCRIGIDRRCERIDIAVFNIDETRWEWTKSLPVLWFV